MNHKPAVIRVLIVNSQELIRVGIKALLQLETDIEVVGEASSAAQIFTLLGSCRPDVILLDLYFNDTIGLDCIAKLRDSHAKQKILIMTGIADSDIPYQAIRQGAHGLIPNNQATLYLTKAIRRIHAGELWLDREMTASVITNWHEPSSNLSSKNENTLTQREMAIALLAAQGAPAKKIGSKLNISDKTVRNQLVCIYSKLGVSGQLELTAKANELGLLVSPDSPAVNNPIFKPMNAN